jgi:HPt (histidine-containing phosphotransfer) domain-containing protein
MMGSSMAKDDTLTNTCADHEIITPVNTLRKAISTEPAPANDDPVARAEDALQELSSEFGAWMHAECERLGQARAAVKRLGFTRRAKDALFIAAHDIKGEAETFGFPGVTGAAKSLCRLIEYTPEPAQIPLALVDQHVDAIRAIHREYARSGVFNLAQELTQRLCDVTDTFLVEANKDRPEIIALIKSPPLAPDNS